MARAIICDRCGSVNLCTDDRFRFVRDIPIIQGIVVVSNAETQAHFDLCDKCIRELNGFLQTKPPAYPVQSIDGDMYINGHPYIYNGINDQGGENK